MCFKESELRIDIRLHRKLAQEPGAKAMDCSDDGAVQSPFVAHPSGSIVRRRSRDQIIQFDAESLLHLVSGAICEGDRDYLIDTDIVVSEDVEIALHKHCCFAGARPGGNGNMSVQCVGSFFLLGLQLAIADGRRYEG